MTSLTAAQFPSAMLQPRLLPWMTQSQMNRAKSSNGSEPEAMMVPTPVPITEMMPRGQLTTRQNDLGPKIDLIRCGARVVGWANRKIQPDDPTLSFFSVVKKALHGTKAPQPLLQWAQDHNDWIEKEASGSLLFYSSGSDSALGRRASIIMVS